MSKKIRDYSSVEWGRVFRLSNDSPSGIVKLKSEDLNDIEKCAVGTQQYRKNGKPHSWVLKFQGKIYVIHRIVWVLTYGSIDSKLVIDHLDGNPFNNQIENLSLKTATDNTRNKCKRRDNTSGFTGVKLVRGVNNYYTAYWNELDGSPKSKHFSILKLGEIKAKLMAVAYREQQIQRLILEGAKYTERHIQV